MHQQLWGYKVEWKSVSSGTGGKKVEYHCTRALWSPPLASEANIVRIPVESMSNHSCESAMLVHGAMFIQWKREGALWVWNPTSKHLTANHGEVVITPDFYPSGPRGRLSWLTFFVVFLSPQERAGIVPQNRPWLTVSFHILSNSSFTNHPLTWRHIL